MANILKKLLHPLEQTQTIRGVELPVGLEFLQLIVTGPPGSGKTYYINQIGGWPNEGYIDFAQKNWWKNQSLIYRPREVHLGLPFAIARESLTVFDAEWLDCSPPPPLECNRIRIPPSRGGILGTNWKRKYIFEFLIPPPKTVFLRRTERHAKGYFPVDDGLSLEMVENQTEVYREVALYLHRAGMQVYVREGVDSPPMRIIEKGDASFPAWLLPEREKTGTVEGRQSVRNFLFPKKSINWLSLGEIGQEVSSPSRIAHDGKTFEMRLGDNLLHFRPEIPLGIKKKHVLKHWHIYSPLSCSAKNILGFFRLEVGKSVVIGRDNDILRDLFDFDSNVAGRHVQVTNRNGDLIITPLTGDARVHLMRTDDHDIRDKIEAHRHEAMLTIKNIYDAPMDLLPADKAWTVIEKAAEAMAEDPFALPGNNGAAGGLITIPERLTPVIVGDLHGQVDNLLKIITENYLLECLFADTVCLILLGDAVHSEIAGEMEDFDNSIAMMDLIFTLKCFFPSNVFYLRGNHDTFDPSLSKNTIPQGLLMKKRLLELRGEGYVAAMETIYRTLPYIAYNNHFIACHAAPPMGKVHFDQLVDIHAHPDIIKDVITKRVQRQHHVAGYRKKDVKRLRKVLGTDRKCPFIVGHTPLDPFGGYWKNVGNIKNHHIIYSGHQEKTQALLIDRANVFPLTFPTEPLSRLIDKLS